MKNSLHSQLSPEALHHTYIIVGEITEAERSVRDFIFSSFNLDSHYADFWIKQYDSLGVDDVTEIAHVHSRKSLGTNKKFIVISTSQITTQAQNSLLKMLEEPAAGTHFFIIMPTIVTLLPTVLSRAHTISLDEIQSSSMTIDQQKNAQNFLEQTIPERLEAIADILSQYDKEQITREGIYQFIYSIEQSVHKAFVLEHADQRKDALEVITRTEEYMRDTSSSIKLLLEYMALSLPRA